MVKPPSSILVTFAPDEPCDLACEQAKQDAIDKENDDAYEEWAEDEADNGCNSCSSFWEDDYEIVKRYLIIFNDDFDVWEGYHYTPSSRHWGGNISEPPIEEEP